MGHCIELVIFVAVKLTRNVRANLIMNHIMNPKYEKSTETELLFTLRLEFDNLTSY